MKITLEELSALRGHAVYSADSRPIGRLETIYADEVTQEPRWIGVLTPTGLRRRRLALVPAPGAEAREGALLVAYSTELVHESPDAGDTGLTHEAEDALIAHYRTPTAASQGPAADALASDLGPAGTIVRSEEELEVSTEPVEVGRVRVRKYVETAPAEAKVTLRRESARIERQRVDRPVEGDSGAFTDEEVEVPLYAEQPIVAKKTVAKEYVAVRKGVERVKHRIREDVRKERIEIEDEGGTVR